MIVMLSETSTKNFLISASKLLPVDAAVPEVFYHPPWTSTATSKDCPSVTSHAIGHHMPDCWAIFIALKRQIPRWAVFPTLFVIFLAISSAWVLPTTLMFLSEASSATKDNNCYRVQLLWANERGRYHLQ
ncbi:hypothetical protein CEUSTIGMA_g5671.t1 [Chlamydomonas eustigma]|uniref:Uncharacterized protein n=1 Tax=Chlamydomonas eustigma TaxID=1157962 RepID=A0A250X5N5_9CHLO|nr:hypothetical protein CEUSTIGMA_g5671.t1 [Chlamydomonas eustigma]|eukprot:GAX78229.1 hypothetical protein CEUSTIGMA_g5671.t1 [Chlamydomonas eustigma]